MGSRRDPKSDTPRSTNMGVKEKLHVGVLCACVEPREAPLLVTGIGTAGERDACVCVLCV